MYFTVTNVNSLKHQLSSRRAGTEERKIKIEAELSHQNSNGDSPEQIIANYACKYGVNGTPLHKVDIARQSPAMGVLFDRQTHHHRSDGDFSPPQTLMGNINFA